MKTKKVKTQLEYPPTPELDKMKEVKSKSQIIGEFLEWLQEDYTIGRYDLCSAELFEVSKPIEEWLAKYFQIDLQKVEEERSNILEWIRKTVGDPAA